jgi:Putative transposase, YhgA-like
MANVHDMTFKKLMQHKPFFLAFFRHYLPETVYETIDWNTSKIKSLKFQVNTSEKYFLLILKNLNWYRILATWVTSFIKKLHTKKPLFTFILNIN